MLIIHSVKIYLSFGRSLRSTRGQGMAADANVSTFCLLPMRTLLCDRRCKSEYLTLLKPRICYKLQKQHSNKLEWTYVQGRTMKFKVDIDLFLCSNYSITPNIHHYLLLMSNQKAVSCKKNFLELFSLFFVCRSELWTMSWGPNFFTVDE